MFWIRVESVFRVQGFGFKVETVSTDSRFVGISDGLIGCRAYRTTAKNQVGPTSESQPETQGLEP